ncbi:DUF2505 domain-containing protein [Goekera deserti]|uniref:DUF2505 domain-containing protein n=1 Tax=Goekera deserti TaxID=2497753 RepID=A0A7K3WC51_9ACTN|nr:DUF2505 domain-containing protein [Goekera deserti]NDI47831.1 DUF2505 family protein [Goekera deserti]NEL53579.1 DUF2505 domain-containing protein [Goekera deserti]
MPVQHSASYPADPDRVLAVLTDESFLREYAAGLGTTVEDVATTRDGDTVRTTARLRASTAGVPSVFTRFLGGQVTVLDTRTWRPDGAGGHRGELTVSTSVMGREAALRGQTVLTASGGSTLSTTTAEATVDAPLVGRQAEAAVRELAQIVLRRESESVLRRLGPDGGSDGGPDGGPDAGPVDGG